MAVEIPNTLKDLPTGSPRYIGKDVKKVEDRAHVTGRTEYIDNVVMPGMLHCAILRSPFAHARVNAVDVSRAEELPGVLAVISGEDA